MEPQARSDAKHYLDLASLGLNRWWRYLMGAVLIVAASLLPLVLITTVTDALSGAGLISRATAGMLMRAASGHVPEKSILAFVVLNLTIIGMILGLAVAMIWLHRRPMLTLVTPHDRIDWRRVLQGAGAALVLLLVVTLVEHLLFPGRYRLVFDPARFLPFMIAVLLLTPIQATAEELIFRGYLMQGLGRLIGSPVVVAVVSSALFAFMHMWNPEVARHGALLMGAAYFTMGLLLAALTLRDGRLELAIGVHAANNVFTALIANNEGSTLQTESILLSPLDPVFAVAALSTISVALYAWFFWRRTTPGSRSPVTPG